MSDGIEPADRMHGNADQFGERGHRSVDDFRQTNQTTRGKNHVLLHEPVEAASQNSLVAR